MNKREREKSGRECVSVIDSTRKERRSWVGIFDGMVRDELGKSRKKYLHVYTPCPPRSQSPQTVLKLGLQFLKKKSTGISGNAYPICSVPVKKLPG